MQNISSFSNDTDICSYIFSFNQTFIMPLICILGFMGNCTLLGAQYRLKTEKGDKMMKFLYYRTCCEVIVFAQRSFNPFMDDASFYPTNTPFKLWLTIIFDRFLRSSALLCSDLCDIAMTVAFLLKFDKKWDVFFWGDEIIMTIFVIFSLVVYIFR